MQRSRIDFSIFFLLEHSSIHGTYLLILSYPIFNPQRIWIHHITNLWSKQALAFHLTGSKFSRYNMKRVIILWLWYSNRSCEWIKYVPQNKFRNDRVRVGNWHEYQSDQTQSNAYSTCSQLSLMKCKCWQHFVKNCRKSVPTKSGHPQKKL